MDHFNYVDGQLCCESVPLARIVADVGSPCYVYSYATLRRHYEVFAAALAGADPASAGTAPRRERTLICYSAKANTNGAVLAARRVALNALSARLDAAKPAALRRPHQPQPEEETEA